MKLGLEGGNKMRIGLSQTITCQVPLDQMVTCQIDVSSSFVEVLAQILNWLRSGQKGVQICVTTNISTRTGGGRMEADEQCTGFEGLFLAALERAAERKETFQVAWQGVLFPSPATFSRFLVVTRHVKE